jgi:hypothetical protein
MRGITASAILLSVAALTDAQGYYFGNAAQAGMKSDGDSRDAMLHMLPALPY